MDVTLPDLSGLLREGDIPSMTAPLGVKIPEDWRWKTMPLSAIFGRAPEGPTLVTLTLNSAAHWMLLREQFPSLQRTEVVGRHTMSEMDFAKMRRLFGGDWR